jgi:hypothetical protein
VREGFGRVLETEVDGVVIVVAAMTSWISVQRDGSGRGNEEAVR